MLKKIVVICLFYNAAIFAGEGASAKSVPAVLDNDYIVMPNPEGGFHCAPLNPKVYGDLPKAEPHVLEGLKKRFHDKFNCELKGACFFRANGEIKELPMIQVIPVIAIKLTKVSDAASQTAAAPASAAAPK